MTDKENTDIEQPAEPSTEDAGQEEGWAAAEPAPSGMAVSDSARPANVELSPELMAALREAEQCVEEKGKEKKEESPSPPTPKEMELKLEILDLRRQIRELAAEIEKKTKEVKHNFDQAKHIQDMLDATKQRVLREKADWFNYGHEPILKELLSVVDNLERAIGHSSTTNDFITLSEGVKLTHRQIAQVLNKFGVTPIESLNQPFDPMIHEAMMEREDDSVPVHTVIEEHQRGYLLKQRLLRPAMVTVSRGGCAAQPTAAPGQTVNSAPEECDENSAEKNITKEQGAVSMKKANSGTEEPAE